MRPLLCFLDQIERVFSVHFIQGGSLHNKRCLKNIRLTKLESRQEHMNKMELAFDLILIPMPRSFWRALLFPLP